jgi:hypothetical protein
MYVGVGCGCGWVVTGVEGKDSCYTMVSAAGNFTQHKAWCESLGAHLLTSQQTLWSQQGVLSAATARWPSLQLSLGGSR